MQGMLFQKELPLGFVPEFYYLKQEAYLSTQILFTHSLMYTE